MPNITKIKSAHNKYNEYGIFTIPARANKVPIGKSWQKKSKPEEIEAWQWDDAKTLSLPCSPNGVEVIDVDLKNDPTGRVVSELLEGLEGAFDEYDNLLINYTPSGGIHIIYRADNTQGNKILAKSEEGRAIIETRGMGGQIIIPPSKGYETDRGSMLKIPKLSNDDRDLMIAICKEFNKYTRKRPELKQRSKTKTSQSLSVFSKYNESADIPTLMETKGWTVIDENDKGIRMKRPGESGNQYSAIVFRDSNKLYVHSTSTEFESERAYSAIDVRVLLGDGTPEYQVIREIMDEMRVPEEYQAEVASGDMDKMKFRISPVESADKKYPIATVDIAEKLDQLGLMFRKNIIKDATEVQNTHTEKWSPVLPEDVNLIYMSLSGGYKLTKSDLMAAIFNTLTAPDVNPITEYWQGLGKWDGIDRMEHLIDALDPIDRPMSRMYISRWLRGVIECSKGEGAINEIVITIVGDHGIGKDRFLRTLIPPGMEDYMSTVSMDGPSRDNNAIMKSSMIINMSEGEVILNNKNSIEKFKAMISAPDITQRALFTDVLGTKPRIASFSLTSNQIGVLNDDTGNRRIAVMESIGEINHDHGIDMAQVYAQILDQEDTWWFTQDEIRALNGASERYKQESMELELVKQHFMVMDADQDIDKSDEMWNATNVANFLMEYSQFNLNIKNIGSALTQFCGPPVRTKSMRRYRILKKVF